MPFLIYQHFLMYCFEKVTTKQKQNPNKNKQQKAELIGVTD